MKLRTRNMLWRIVEIAALGGIVYGAIAIIEVQGIGKGLLYTIASIILGALAVEVLYPLWFGR